MPFDAITARPFMRHGTADLAAMVDAGGADLSAILAELSHRERKPARILAERIRAMLPQAVTVQPGAPADAPAFEVIPCAHGEVLPEARETVVSVERVAAVEPAKPARKAAERTASLGATPKQRAAFTALSPARQSYLRAVEAWRVAFKLHLYSGGPAPGPRPVDTDSVEACAVALTEARNADWQAWREAEHAAALREGRAWKSSEARRAAIIVQPAGRYTGNPAADARLVRNVARWMRAARIMSGKLSAQAFRERMERSRMARERVAKARKAS